MNYAPGAIVSDGAQRLRRAKGYLEARQRARAEVARKAEEETKGASFWRRVWIGLKNQRAVRAILNKDFPPAALYLAAPTFRAGH